MTNYVLGFLFTPDEDRVVLLQKTHGPASMAGKLNGIGGKIEDDEVGRQAMQRETREEIGLVDIKWKCFGTMGGEGWTCQLFRAHDENAREAVGLEDEEVWLVDPSDLPSHTMQNLSYLIPLARDAEAWNCRVVYPPFPAVDEET